MTTTLRDETVSVWDDRITMHVKVGGSGPSLVYLHAVGGLVWDPFIERLSQSYTIYAPEFPGTSASDPHAVDQLDSLWEVVLAYEQAMRALGVEGSPVMGQSFGGMLAAELCSGFPTLFSRAVLLDPVGLWRDDIGVSNWIAAAPTELPAMLFADPTCAAAQAMFTPPDDPEVAVAGTAALVWAIGCTGKFLWPIPDRGLRRRLHRMTVPTLVVWGEQDRLISSRYATEFGNALRDSEVLIVPNCGHIPQMEQPEITFEAVAKFLVAG